MEETTENPSTLMNNALKWGGILGGIACVLVILWYAIDYALLAQIKIGLISLAVSIGVVIYSGITYRNEIGGYMSYGKAFMHGIIVFAVSGIIGTIFNYILFNVIDPELPAKLTEVAIQNAEEMARGFGAPEDAIEKAMADTRTRMETQYTAGGLAKGYLFILIFGAVFTLITSLFVRRNQPVDM